jgi:tetratricopeptide (TPR) repeat protein
MSAGSPWRQAETLLYAGQRREALSAYRRALAEEPQNPTLLTVYAMACLELGRWQEIEALVQKVLAGQTQGSLRVAAYVTLIEAMRSQGRYLDSNRIGHLLLQEEISDRGRSIACYELAWNQAEMEGADLEEALALAHRGVDLSSPDLRYLSLAALGWVHFKRRELDRSVELLRQSNELDSSPRTLLQLGIALLARGDHGYAREALRTARRLMPEETVVDEKVFEVLKGHPWPALA